MTATAAPVTLLKARQRHSRWFAFMVIPLVVFSARLEYANWQMQTMEWVGFLFTVACVLGRSYCSAFIGGIKNERVVREGPFSVVRNPLYVFSFLGVIGIGLQSDKFLVLLLLVASFIIYYKPVVRREEGFLVQKFGQPYQQYMAEVPRWFPKLSMWSEPAEIVVRPYFIRHTMLDAVVFFIPWPVFKLLAMLQAQGTIPHFITLF